MILLLLAVGNITLPIIVVSGQEEQWLTYENSDFGISLQYPASWNITKFNTSMLAPAHRIIAIETANTHFGISSEELFANTTVKEYAREKYNQLMESDFFQRINDESIVIDGVPAWQVEYQMSFPDLVANVINIWFLKDNMVFEIAYTTDDPKAHSENLPIFQKMINTFQITPT
jgi:hypothetical protein